MSESTPLVTDFFRDDFQNEIQERIHRFIGRKNYPCVPAQAALRNREIRVGVYTALECPEGSRRLHADLRAFSEEWERTALPYLTYWAVFPFSGEYSEEAFESSLWNQLSRLARIDGEPWDPAFSSNPEDRNFAFSLGGKAYFVVGMHRNSSRKSRAFPYASLVFNRFDQFESLEASGRYDGVVRANRARELAFQGSVNPMVKKYGEIWEAIQFSGRENPENWKCPFHRNPASLESPA